MDLCATLSSFAHSVRNSISFTNAQTDITVVIASHDGHTELKPATTFNNFGYTGNL